MKKHIYPLLGAAVFLLGCSDDDSIKNGPTPDPDPNTDVMAQHFMWQAMNQWYFWQKNVSDLSDSRFSSDAQYTEYLQANPDPEEFFNEKLLFREDRFSFLEADYRELVNNLGGISKSNGLEFGLIQLSGSNDVFGYVQFILPDSDASEKDIARGELFTRVDGVQLTVENYRGLLFGANDTYTLGMAHIEGNTIFDDAKEVSLTKRSGQVENPILVAKTLDVGGTKVAYLMYNRFLGSFDEQLNTVFGEFKAAGATELVLDMRYNPGGSVNSSRLLASMVYGTNTSELYIKQRWNDKIQGQLSAAQLEDRFADKTNKGTPINTLGLSRVYILATNGSASASELVINGLAPYVQVIHIGETTRGKNEFSITLVDDRQGSYIYDPDRVGQINPKNEWGLQPLVGRNENADGFYDYTNGLAPDIALEEDLTNLGVLGEVSEPLLARALQEITGHMAKMDLSVEMPAEAFTSSRLHTPLKDNMYLDKPLDLPME